MVNAVRLYLIECGGFIYKSEIEDDTAWKIVAASVISEICPWQVYCLYNKETIYIGCRDLNEYYKFICLAKIWLRFYTPRRGAVHFFNYC
ncbi:unnamed protein product [Blepharisma stoltei]|uniref:Uncharacterized protein n=1 Tax=Blepharisma stoltei TaxID=1481888 RepID=A0AAU9KFL4_9CILI|nr:unnamed protein product [Blepharisma stoltei]